MTIKLHPGKKRSFTAICILIELDSRLSEYYWVNIADTAFTIAGILSTLLTGANEYEGSHVAYLTKYTPIRN